MKKLTQLNGLVTKPAGGILTSLSTYKPA
jgi:hypothetical protein